MAPVAPSIEPTVVLAGDLWTWTRDPGPDFPIADGWVLSYALRGVGKLDTITDWVTNDGRRWTVAIPAASTSPLEAGRYTLFGLMTNSSDRRTILRHSLLVQANPAGLAAGELQSSAERLIAACDAELERRITGSGEAFNALTIHGRSITMMTVEEIQGVRATAARRLAKEQNRNTFGRRINFVFRRAR